MNHNLDMIRVLAILSLFLTPAFPSALAADPGATVVTRHETIPNPVFGSTFRVSQSCQTSSSPCAWESPSTWTAGRIPDGTTPVIIDGKVQIHDQAATALDIGLYDNGVLSFDRTQRTKLTVGTIVVFSGGTLIVGTETEPISSTVTAEIVIRDLPFLNDPKQHLHGVLVIDGTVRMHGRRLGETFIRTATEPQRSLQAVMLASSALAAGWRVSDVIVVPSSAQCAVASNNGCPDQSEDRAIAGISSDGLTLTLNGPLQFDHPGARSLTGSLDFTPHIVHKTRNVVIRSENPNGLRGHVLLHGRADVDLRYVSFQQLGRTDTRDLGPTNQKGRYPLHAHHLIGPTTRQTNGYQFTLVGNVIDFGQENRQLNRKWGLSIHESHYGLIAQNIVDLASGAGLVTEDASETGNRFQKNFVLRIVGGTGGRTEDRDPGEGTKLGRAGVSYWFNGGGGNIYEDNVAAYVAECTYCYGFKFDNVYNSPVTIPTSQGADPYVAGQGTTVDSYTIGLQQFVRNEAYAVPNGLTIWWVCTEYETPRDSCTSLVKDFRLWHHHRWGYFGYETNQLTLDGFVHRGDVDILSNQYESVTAFQLEDYMQRRLTIRNADVQGAAYGMIGPVHRDRRGSSGSNVGITVVENSFFGAGTGIILNAPWSVNGSADLSPQTTILRNVRFAHPTTRRESHVAMSPRGGSGNTTVRNDVLISDYNQAAGTNGDDLYMIPAYQSTARCDNAIGGCGSNLTANYPSLAGAYVYPLRSGGSVDVTPPAAPTNLRFVP